MTVKLRKLLLPALFALFGTIVASALYGQGIYQQAPVQQYPMQQQFPVQSYPAQQMPVQTMPMQVMPAPPLPVQQFPLQQGATLPGNPVYQVQPQIRPQAVIRQSNRQPSAVGQVATQQGKVVLSDQQWRSRLNDLEYRVTRQKGTENAYSGSLWNNKANGTYTCKCCGQPLFDSATKFESGTGWPSFFAPISGQSVMQIGDYSGGMARTEVVCSRCDAHLGHVFNDGPAPTGKRYCMNSVALRFEQARGGGQMQSMPYVRPGG